MNIEYTKISPTQNITIMVKTPVPAERQSWVSERLMALEPDCEQVGFIEPSQSCDAKLKMMGGEFCGNASMSLAALLARRDGMERQNLKLEVSGVDEPVSVFVKAAPGGYDGVVDMPLPTEIAPHKFGKYTLPLVRFPGIAHAVITDDMPIELAKTVVREWGNELNEGAFGLMLLDRENLSLTPIVYVRDTDTVVLESSCASGTAAVGAYLAGEELTLKEPGGAMSVRTRRENGVLTKLELMGNVVFLREGQAEV